MLNRSGRGTTRTTFGHPLHSAAFDRSRRLEPADDFPDDLDAALGQLRSPDHLFAVALVLAAQGDTLAGAIFHDAHDRPAVNLERVHPIALNRRAAVVEPDLGPARDRGLHFVAHHGDGGADGKALADLPGKVDELVAGAGVHASARLSSGDGRGRAQHAPAVGKAEEIVGVRLKGLSEQENRQGVRQRAAAAILLEPPRHALAGAVSDLRDDGDASPLRHAGEIKEFTHGAAKLRVQGPARLRLVPWRFFGVA